MTSRRQSRKALTLSPALGGLFLQRPDHTPVDNALRHPFAAITRGFNRGVSAPRKVGGGG